MKYFAIGILMLLVGCNSANDNPIHPGDGTWLTIIKTQPDENGVVCYKSWVYGGWSISCVKVK